MLSWKKKKKIREESGPAKWDMRDGTSQIIFNKYQIAILSSHKNVVNVESNYLVDCCSHEYSSIWQINIVDTVNVNTVSFC